MREDLKTCVEIVIDDIKSMSGNELETYLFELCKMVGTESEIEVDAENILEISGVSEKLEFLDAVYENIENEEDKNTFLRELLSNEHNLDYKIIEHFKNKVQVPEELENDTNDSGSDEELEDEQELDGPTPNPNYSSDDSNTDETIDDNEEDLEDEQEKNNDEQLIDGPAITEYKAKTNEMEKELEELMANLNDSGNPTNNEPDYNNAIETLKNSIKENNEIRGILNNPPYNMGLPIIEPSNDLVTAMEEATKVAIIEKEIKEKESEIEKLNNDIDALTANIERMKQEGKPVNVMNYTLNDRIKQRDSLLKDIADLKYRKEIASKSAVHLDATEIRNIIVDEISYTNETINAIANYRKDIESKREHVPYELQLNGEGTYPDRLNNIINNLFEAQKTFENQSNEINVNNSKNKELNDSIEKLKAEIEERKQNIAKYYDASNDIKNIRNEIKSGKNPEDLKDSIDSINQKIENITDDKLKDELKEELNKALTQQVKKDPNPTPIPPKGIEKDSNKWKKWISGIAGVALGIGIVGLTPLTGIAGGLAVVAGSQLIKAGVNLYHNHLVKKGKELGKENEVTDIEKTGKLAKFKEKIKCWFRDENIVKNINWFLNGTAIGGMAMGLFEATVGINYGTTPAPKDLTGTGHDISGGTPPEPNTPNIKVGDSTNGMDLTTGHDSPQFAINGTNPEALNQGIMNDGNTVVRRIMDAQGNTYSSTNEALKAGKSLSELTFDTAKGLELNPALDRAWINAETATRTL